MNNIPLQKIKNAIDKTRELKEKANEICDTTDGYQEFGRVVDGLQTTFNDAFEQYEIAMETVIFSMISEISELVEND